MLDLAARVPPYYPSGVRSLLDQFGKPIIVAEMGISPTGCAGTGHQFQLNRISAGGTTQLLQRLLSGQIP